MKCLENAEVDPAAAVEHDANTEPIRGGVGALTTILQLKHREVTQSRPSKKLSGHPNRGPYSERGITQTEALNAKQTRHDCSNIVRSPNRGLHRNCRVTQTKAPVKTVRSPKPRPLRRL